LLNHLTSTLLFLYKRKGLFLQITMQAFSNNQQPFVLVPWKMDLSVGMRGCMRYVLWHFIGIGLFFKKM